MADDTPKTILIPGLIRDKIYKKLTFANKGLTIEKPLSFAPLTFIPAKDIKAVRYGVNWLRGYKFVFGRQYIIQIMDGNNHITSIKLNSYYGIRRKAFGQIWSAIFRQLWDNYLVNIYEHYSGLYDNKQEFELSGVKFYPFGIGLDNRSLFWNEIALSNYKTYFMIHQRDELKKTKRCSFMNDWNAFILQRLLKKIIKEQDSYISNN